MDELVRDADLGFQLAELARAENYQNWVMDRVRPHLGRRVLELGAGTGNMSRLLPPLDLKVLSESDPRFLPILRDRFKNELRTEVASLDLEHDWAPQARAWNVDTILSFNVMEHLADDHRAFAQQIRVLRESKAEGPKRMVCFVPAHSWAFGTFDKAFQHYRRYDRGPLLQRLRLDHPEVEFTARSFNLIGLAGWVFHGRILRRSQFSTNMIQTFERLCPWIRGIDDVLHDRLHLPWGQSLLIVGEVF